MRRVFIADDEEDVLASYELELNLTGRYAVKTERFGKRVFEALGNKEFVPDILVLDIFFDYTDRASGEEIYRLIRQDPAPLYRNMPVLIMSGKIPETDLEMERPEEKLFYMLKARGVLLKDKLDEIFCDKRGHIA